MEHKMYSCIFIFVLFGLIDWTVVADNSFRKYVYLFFYIYLRNYSLFKNGKTYIPRKLLIMYI